MSRPIVVTACMTWLLRIVGPQTAPTSLALARRVEEPSTASIADIRADIDLRRFVPLSDLRARAPNEAIVRNLQTRATVCAHHFDKVATVVRGPPNYDPRITYAA